MESNDRPLITSKGKGITFGRTLSGSALPGESSTVDGKTLVRALSVSSTLSDNTVARAKTQQLAREREFAVEQEARAMAVLKKTGSPTKLTTTVASGSKNSGVTWEPNADAGEKKPKINFGKKATNWFNSIGRKGGFKAAEVVEMVKEQYEERGTLSSYKAPKGSEHLSCKKVCYCYRVSTPFPSFRAVFPPFNPSTPLYYDVTNPSAMTSTMMTFTTSTMTSLKTL